MLEDQMKKSSEEFALKIIKAFSVYTNENQSISIDQFIKGIVHAMGSTMGYIVYSCSRDRSAIENLIKEIANYAIYTIEGNEEKNTND